jgi:hypothetical protein
VATFSCFRFTPGLAFGEKDIGHPTITEYLSLSGQGKLWNRKIILERKQFFTEILSRSGRLTKNQFLSSNPTKPTLFRNSVLAVVYLFNKVKNKCQYNKI